MGKLDVDVLSSRNKLKCALYPLETPARTCEKIGVQPWSIPALLMAFILVGCHAGPQPSDNKQTDRVPQYPRHWWAAVPREGAPAWEILPQEAGPGEVILSKRNELGLLSNFAATPFDFRGHRYASLEGFWQMMKYPESDDDPRSKFPGLHWAHTREQVGQLTAFEAKRAGTLAEQNMAQMGIDWVSFEGRRFPYKPVEPGEHYELIVAATWEKVRQNPEVKKVLLSTGNLVLKPDHHQEPNAPAAWRYYEILTNVRTELQRQKTD
jgi:hypothetical protein